METFVGELERVGVNRFNLWCEYIQQYPGGYSYSQFCYHLQQYQSLQKTTMVMDDKPGDLLFINFDGHPMEYIDTATGEFVSVQVFFACLGYSQYSYVETVPSQKCEDFITALNNCLVYMQGVPQGIVPDNLNRQSLKQTGMNRSLIKSLKTGLIITGQPLSRPVADMLRINL